jgi:creatinine amidohydrolase
MNRVSSVLCVGAIWASLFASAPVAESQILQLGELNTRQIEALNKQKTVVLIPGGILEEHGPYLPSFTDGYVTQAFTDALAKAIVLQPGWTVVVFPQIPLGSDPANTIGELAVFPGSYPVRTATVRQVYMDLGNALGAQGFRWVFLIHNHGAPTNHKALDDASDYFHDSYGGTMVNLFGLVPVTDCCGVEAKFLSPAALREEGVTVHSGADETSVLEFLKPNLLAPDYRQAVSWTSQSIPGLVKNARTKGWPGYFGAPRLADASLGAQMFDKKSAKANETALAILNGADPAKIPRYSDRMLPVVQRFQPDMQAEEQKMAKREEDWLKAHVRE